MAKKRSAPVGGRRENRVEPPPPQVNSASGRRNLVVFFITSSIIATVAYRFRQSSPPQYQESYVYEQGLVTIHANYQDVLTVSTAQNQIITPFSFFTYKQKRLFVVLILVSRVVYYNVLGKFQSIRKYLSAPL
ncbi:hypothetical protein V8G54_033851 [Vigna mungo]|uniref:Transmembrane protein n=1 Tax=Vigna mungo TaxID=3915 RepID=A0AAQ3MPT7_VIGMU